MRNLMEPLHNAVLRLHIGYRNLRHRYSVSRLADQRGAATVEYALLIAVIVTMVIAAATFMYDPLKEFFLGIIEKITSLAEKEAEPAF